VYYFGKPKEQKYTNGNTLFTYVYQVCQKRKYNEWEISFTVDPKLDPIVVEADKIRIYEVISNLLTNATKFTQKSNSDSSNGISTITIFAGIKSNQAHKKVVVICVEEVILLA
jgi:signal transduction histidine kinase